MNRPWLVDSALIVHRGNHEQIDELLDLELNVHPIKRYALSVPHKVYILVGNKKHEKMLRQGENTWVQLTGIVADYYVLGWTIVSHNNEITGLEYIQSFYPERGWNIAELIISQLRNKYEKPVYPLTHENVSFWAHNSHLLQIEDQLRNVYIGDFVRNTMMLFTSFEAMYSKYVNCCQGLAMDYKNFRQKYRLEIQNMFKECKNAHDSVRLMAILNSEIHK